MKLQWDGHDMGTWDVAHAQAAGALQQDWAYGSTRVAMGSSVLRGVVHADGVPVAMAAGVAPARSSRLLFSAPSLLLPLPTCRHPRLLSHYWISFLYQSFCGFKIHRPLRNLWETQASRPANKQRAEFRMRMQG